MKFVMVNGEKVVKIFHRSNLNSKLLTKLVSHLFDRSLVHCQSCEWQVPYLSSFALQMAFHQS